MDWREACESLPADPSSMLKLMALSRHWSAAHLIRILKAERLERPQRGGAKQIPGSSLPFGAANHPPLTRAEFRFRRSSVLQRAGRKLDHPVKLVLDRKVLKKRLPRQPPALCRGCN